MLVRISFLGRARLALMIRGFLVAFCLLISRSACQSDPVKYNDPTAPLEARVNDLFDRMTPDERLSLLSGTGFTSQPIPRLGIPGMGMADAGQGVRGGITTTQGPATLFPCGTTIASTWNRELLARIGRAIGEEAINKGAGAQVLLGPAVNIHRTPLGGRNGEFMSEDPYLTGQLAVGYIQGLQSTGCAACVKHFACNNQEFDRNTTDAIVDERALREIYLPAFEAAVKQGHVWTLMTSYNKVNGQHSTANKVLVTEILKREWNWDGMVMSDWGAVHETSGVVNAGNDLEMPGPGYLAPYYLQTELANGTITQAEIDAAARRILRAMIRTGVVDGPRELNSRIVNSASHRQLAFEAATQGIVLLKNDGGILPLNARTTRSIAIIGEPAKNWQMGSYGSPYVTPLHSTSAYDGLKDRAGNAISVTYHLGLTSRITDRPIPSSVLTSATGQGQGLSGEYFRGMELAGEPIATRTDAQIQLNFDDAKQRPAGVPHEGFSVRWTGTLTAPETGRYHFIMTCDDGSRLFIGDTEVISHWVPSNGDQVFGSVDLVAGQRYPIRAEYFQASGLAYARMSWVLPHEDIFSSAVQAARTADVALVFVTSGGEGEGADRLSMALPGVQDDLIRAISAVNKKTIVILNNGGPVLMTKWIGDVPGVIEAGFPGQEGGAALAAILFGDVTPSGKLTDTIAAAREDYPDFPTYPGVADRELYSEGIYVGYRHFDKRQIAPIFPFGYGLSYTTFTYSALSVTPATWNGITPITVTAQITNSGSRPGAEIAELYVHCLKPNIDRPLRELKGFTKLELSPGETKTATFTLTPRDLSYWDVSGNQWKADVGDYQIEIGASSRDIRLSAPVSLTRTVLEPVVLER